MDKFTEYMLSFKPGPIAKEDFQDKLLSQCWDSFNGGESGGMEAYKLVGRMEQIEWKPPVLRFVIERHGGTVRGSSRAELRTWLIDLDKRTATVIASTYKQVRPGKERAKVDPIVKVIAADILSGLETPRIRRSKDGSVRIVMGEVLPSEGTAKQTLAGRRKRLRDALAAELRPHGWRETSANIWAQDPG